MVYGFFHWLYFCMLLAKYEIQAVYKIPEHSMQYIKQGYVHLYLLYNEVFKNLQITSQTFDRK
jgi:hypothetical protein